jgi:hypothetical protein
MKIHYLKLGSSNLSSCHHATWRLTTYRLTSHAVVHKTCGLDFLGNEEISPIDDYGRTQTFPYHFQIHRLKLLPIREYEQSVRSFAGFVCTFGEGDVRQSRYVSCRTRHGCGIERHEVGTLFSKTLHDIQ